MIEAFDDRLGGFLQVAVVDQVALGGIDVAFDDQIEAKRVAVEPPTLMVGREGRQVVGRLEVECFCQADTHGIEDSRGARADWKQRES